MDAPDLQVACRPSSTHDGDVAFVAERLVPSSSAHWVLYVNSDQTAVQIHQVVPEPLGHALHATGALGLLFPGQVTTVQLDIAAGDAVDQRWRFWVDDEPDVADADAGAEPGSPLRASVRPLAA
jgi:hypothetical protein